MCKLDGVTSVQSLRILLQKFFDFFSAFYKWFDLWLFIAQFLSWLHLVVVAKSFVEVAYCAAEFLFLHITFSMIDLHELCQMVYPCIKKLRHCIKHLRVVFRRIYAHDLNVVRIVNKNVLGVLVKFLKFVKNIFFILGQWCMLDQKLDKLAGLLTWQFVYCKKLAESWDSNLFKSSCLLFDSA